MQPVLEIIEIICKELASEINGRIQPPVKFIYESASNPSSVIGKFKERIVIVDLESWGEVTIKYRCNAKYGFEIKPNTFINRIGWLAAKRMATGNTEFDRRFILRSDDRVDLPVWRLRREIIESIFMLAPFSEVVYKRKMLYYISEVKLDRSRSDEILKKLEILNDVAISLENYY